MDEDEDSLSFNFNVEHVAKKFGFGICWNGFCIDTANDLSGFERKELL